MPTLDVQPQPLNLQMLADWPRPEIAPPPWGLGAFAMELKPLGATGLQVSPLG
ncbi:MAG: hypothetical protein HC889_16060, partial [Synechococcaceae cyanobacterium SM1_2_3]|nr:hypothetical protein [Synechococcaceae cyanobacterium SM1_2_3]